MRTAQQVSVCAKLKHSGRLRVFSVLNAGAFIDYAYASDIAPDDQMCYHRRSLFHLRSCVPTSVAKVTASRRLITGRCATKRAGVYRETVEETSRQNCTASVS